MVGVQLGLILLNEGLAVIDVTLHGQLLKKTNIIMMKLAITLTSSSKPILESSSLTS